LVTRRARRRPGENRANLIEAGLIEFGVLGYRGCSTAAVARRAGVPQPHVYANFANKQDLFLACLQFARESTLQSGTSGAVEAFLYQAVAAVQDPSLPEALRSDLSDFQQLLGPEFDHALVRAAHRLLATTPARRKDEPRT